MALQNVDDATFVDEVLNQKGYVLVDFWAPWCGPCRMFGAVLENAAATLDGKIKIVKYNCDESQSVAQQLNIRGVPTIAVYKDGQLVVMKSGAMNQAQFAEFVKEFV